MERITNKRIIDERPIYTTPNSNITSIPNFIIGEDYTGVAIEKLGKIEDIEEKLGIDLETIFKALEDGIYCRVRVGSYKGDVFEWNIEIQHCVCKGISEEGLIVVDNADYYPDSDFTARYTEYKTGWALTKEELEKGE